MKEIYRTPPYILTMIKASRSEILSLLEEQENNSN